MHCSNVRTRSSIGAPQKSTFPKRSFDTAREPCHPQFAPAENIYLVAADDGGDLVTVLDFGVAKLLGEATGKPLTVTGRSSGRCRSCRPSRRSRAPTCTRSR